MARPFNIIPFVAALLLAACTSVKVSPDQDGVLSFPVKSGQTVILPMQDDVPEARITIMGPDGPVGVPWTARLAVDRTDYCIPYTAASDVVLKVEGIGADALFFSDLHYGKSSECWYNPSPEIHFKPLYGWTNDPNGMVWKDGLWHLFYQFNPFGSTWGNMTWGHAVSRDLRTWEHLPQAIEPDGLGMIFSGSAVVDTDNTSGFGKDAIVAIYTSAGARQTQSIAWSTDGISFTKYEGNPVLENPAQPDFRDPKVFWHEPTRRWIMILAAGNAAEIYSSPNLREWDFESRFGEGCGCHAGVWECPDLFELDGRWVCLISCFRDDIKGPSTQYFIGNFDGHVFVPDSPEEQWLDEGTDFYAAVTWSNAPDGRRVLLGWAADWRYAEQTPTTGWRCMMSTPRELNLDVYDSRLRVFSYPAGELSGKLDSNVSTRLVLSADAPSAEVGGVKIIFEPALSELSLQRRAGTVSARLEPRDSHDVLVVMADGLVECFVDGGAVCMSCLSEISPCLNLPAPRKDRKTKSLSRTLESRHSVREFSSEPLSLQDLSDLCWAACGMSRDDSHRTAPTAMNRQEVRLFVFDDKAVYEYDAPANSLRLCVKGDHRGLVAGTAGFSQDFVLAAPVSLVMVIDFELFGSEGQRALMMGCVDVGNVSENVNLFCESAGLVTVPRATMDVEGIRRILGLGGKQLPVMNNPVGYPSGK